MIIDAIVSSVSIRKFKPEAEAREKAGKKLDPTQILGRVSEDEHQRETSRIVAKQVGRSALL